MAYEHIEEIQSRRSEKIALFLTMENAMGLMLGALPAYVISGSFPFVLRVLVVGVCALLGVAVTLDVGGMAGYERFLWRMRGLIRMRLQSPVILPEQLNGTIAHVQHERALAVNGPVQLRPMPIRHGLASLPLVDRKEASSDSHL